MNPKLDLSEFETVRVQKNRAGGLTSPANNIAQLLLASRRARTCAFPALLWFLFIFLCFPLVGFQVFYDSWFQIVFSNDVLLLAVTLTGRTSLDNNNSESRKILTKERRDTSSSGRLVVLVKPSISAKPYSELKKPLRVRGSGSMSGTGQRKGGLKGKPESKDGVSGVRNEMDGQTEAEVLKQRTDG